MGSCYARAAVACLAVLAMAALPASAQHVYKSVDKDGRTVYSDHPPGAEAAGGQGGGVARQMDISLEGMPRDAAAALQRGGPVQPLDAANAIIGMLRAVEDMQKLCARESPDVQERIRRAVAGWNARNDNLVRQADAIHKAHFNPAEYQQFYRGVEGLNGLIQSRLSAAPAAERAEWCARLPANLANPRADPSLNQRLVAALAPSAR